MGLYVRLSDLNSEDYHLLFRKISYRTKKIFFLLLLTAISNRIICEEFFHYHYQLLLVFQNKLCQETSTAELTNLSVLD